MSEKIAKVRVAYDVAYAQRSVDGVRECFAKNFTWHSRSGWPGRATYGLDEMPELWADLDDTFSGYELVPARFEEVAENYVLVEVSQSVRLRGGDARVETVVWHLWLVEELPAEAWVFAERAEALDVAGVSG